MSSVDVASTMTGPVVTVFVSEQADNDRIAAIVNGGAGTIRMETSAITWIRPKIWEVTQHKLVGWVSPVPSVVPFGAVWIDPYYRDHDPIAEHQFDTLVFEPGVPLDCVDRAAVTGAQLIQLVRA